MWPRKSTKTIATPTASHREEIQAIKQHMAVIEFNPDGTILDASPAFLQVVGYELSEVVGQHHRIFCTKALASSSAYEQFWRRLRAGEGFSDRFMRLTRDGNSLWLEATYLPVTAADGSVSKVIKIATDISQQIQAEHHHSSYINAINRSMAVIEFTSHGHVVSANDNFLKLMGYEARDVIGKHHSLFCTAEDAASAEYQQFWAKLNQGEFLSDRFRRVTRGGQQVWLRATYNPLFDAAGKLYGVVKFASDISAQVQRRDSEAAAALLAHDIAKETDVSADRGTRTVAETVQVVTEITRDLDAMAGQIAGLNKQSEQISSIVQVIRSIADQTNLLALNAAIEAARAGEQGRGFAVVADEVRTLASRSGASTEEIQQVINRLQAESRAAVDVMSRGRQQSERVVEYAGKASAALEQINGHITQISDQNIQVATATEEQSCVVEEINRNVEEINNLTQETTRIADQLNQSSTSLQDLSTQLDELVGHFKL